MRAGYRAFPIAELGLGRRETKEPYSLILILPFDVMFLLGEYRTVREWERAARKVRRVLKESNLFAGQGVERLKEALTATLEDVYGVAVEALRELAVEEQEVRRSEEMNVLDRIWKGEL